MHLLPCQVTTFKLGILPWYPVILCGHYDMARHRMQLHGSICMCKYRQAYTLPVALLPTSPGGRSTCTTTCRTLRTSISWGPYTTAILVSCCSREVANPSLHVLHCLAVVVVLACSEAAFGPSHLCGRSWCVRGMTVKSGKSMSHAATSRKGSTWAEAGDIF